MPRNINANLLARINAGATTLTELLFIQPKVGQAIGFTRYVRDIVIGVDLFRSRPGMIVTRASANIQLSVDNSEAAGGFQDGVITEADVWNKKFEGATFLRKFCDYENLAYGAHTFQKGVIGTANVADNAFRVELRSLTQLLQQPVGDVISASCRVKVVGDAECKLNVAAGTHPQVGLAYRSGAQTVESVEGLLRFSATMSQSWPTDFFDNGLLTWLTGRNAPYQMEVKSYARNGATGVSTFILQEPMGYDILPGETFTVDWGCDRTFDRCFLVNNVINRRAEDYLIGEIEARRVAG